MDTDKEDLIQIDPNKLPQSHWAIDGHGDAYHSLDPLYGPVTSGPAITWPNGSPSWTFSDLSITSPPQAKISLQGEDADIEINGESVVGMLKDIRDRLNILQVSEEMEAEWDELRALREQYEAKLAECQEKSRAWKALQRK